MLSAGDGLSPANWGLLSHGINYPTNPTIAIHDPNYFKIHPSQYDLHCFRCSIQAFSASSSAATANSPVIEKTPSPELNYFSKKWSCKDTSGALAPLKPNQPPQVRCLRWLVVNFETATSYCRQVRASSDRSHSGSNHRSAETLRCKVIVQLLQSFEAPLGTTVYIEQSTPYPQDGKQGWWSGGFGYGLWIGLLVASGFSVTPVPSSAWKSEFQLTRERSNKDYSREIASSLFPSLSSLLKRKKDHGRAEALLIAAYGKGIKINSDSLCAMEN
ncbi:hypothetical protein HAX54_038904 [Datura stramonium]|uniref:Uncharacterized protein n=1 Tax=Datura stramonium TaxID=4076 RepID=A0ABS8SIP2_DATST|nr:hypothetical protein [Datura stramonium]